MNKATIIVPAKDWKFEVQGEAGSYVAVGSVLSFAITPSKEDANTYDFDSGGWEEHIPIKRGYSLTVSGYRLEDVSVGTRDAGQVILETLGDKFGDDSKGNFRLTSPGGKYWKFAGSVQIGQGGGETEAVTWNATILVDGKVEK